MKSKGSWARLCGLIASASLVVASSAEGAMAQSRVPQFRDYPASATYNGKTATLILTRDDMAFRTRLRWAAKNLKPNFAGRYILTTWGCGTSCIMGAVIDAKTGRVHWWDFSICCWGYDIAADFQPVKIRLDSKMIVFTGARNERDGDTGAHFYKFENGRFVHLHSVMKESKREM